VATKKCRYGRKKSGACKRKPGPKRGSTKGRRSKARRCPKGVVKSGPRKGRCKKRR
jgi:hypothetical protein